MRLSTLLQPVSPTRVLGVGITRGGVLSDPEVTSIHYRSGDVRPGGIFVAIPGNIRDGHDFIDEALENGAVAVVAERLISKKTIFAQVPDARRALAVLSAKFYANPADKMVLIGITGTNGKTTTAGLIEVLLVDSGYRVGVIGTGNYRYGGRVFHNPLTTPAAPDLQAILSEMRAAGITHVIMEVSSHALDQKRVAGCRFDIGVFTNLTQDHLDYHGNMASYGECKKRLFTDNLKRDGEGKRPVAVINSDDAMGRELQKVLRYTDVISVGDSGYCQVRPENIHYTPRGIKGKIISPLGRIALVSPLVGRFNLENILCAVGVASSLGLSAGAVGTTLASFGGMPGRLERVENGSDRFVFVDYAHTPDALEKVLKTLREISPGRLFCVFGCGGDRDRTKRPQMGTAAAAVSDYLIITSDNPRSEEPAAIIREIVVGIPAKWHSVRDEKELGEGKDSRRYLVEPDRRRAIRAAVGASGSRDTILIAGKGCETCQILRAHTIAFDDRVEAAEALSFLGNQKRKMAGAGL